MVVNCDRMMGEYGALRLAGNPLTAPLVRELQEGIVYLVNLLKSEDYKRQYEAANS
jgi:hypothetical protein